MFLLAISIFPVGDRLIYFFLEKKYKNNTLPINTDIIFVPSGNKKRLETALNLKLSNYNKALIIYSTGNPMIKNDKIKLMDIDYAYRLKKNYNLKNEEFRIIKSSRNTFENFKELNKILSKSKNILVITSGFHIDRSKLISSKYNHNFTFFASDYAHETKKLHIINSYQNFSVIKNLEKMDLFIRELLAIFVTKVIK